MKSRDYMCLPLALLLAGVSGCRKQSDARKADALLAAYDTETDWSDAQRTIPLSYEQAQGKRIFYQECVWCHADATPAGPSNRSNLLPVPPLLNACRTSLRWAVPPWANRR